MSRHRNVRNLDLYEEYYEEEEEDYDGNEYSESEQSEGGQIYNSAGKKVGEGNGQDESDEDPVAYVESVVGYGFAEDQIVEALEKYDYNTERAINYLLDSKSKSSSKQQKASSSPSKQQPKQLKPAQFTPKAPLNVPKPAAAPGQAKVLVLKSSSSASVTSSASSSQPVSQVSFDMAALGLESTKKAGSEVHSSMDALQSTSSSSKPTSTPKASRKKLNLQEEYAKRTSSPTHKDTMNLVVVGHVDAGKSTLMGHLLYLLGNVSDRVMQKFQRDATKLGKGSFAFAWVLDETDEERERGITMDIATTNFETPHKKFTVLDAPGHRDFIPNMISGAAQADVAILVVDASTGEFEAGFELGGQTREHALLCRSLGVQQLIVAVNKLDNTNWSEARYHEIMQKLTPFLTQSVGFKKSKVFYIPCSGLTGQNLLKRSEPALSTWYTGPTLVEQMDAFEPPLRALEKPLRLSVTDFFKGGANISVGGGSGAVTVVGRIESGWIQLGETVQIMPIQESGTVKSIEHNDETVSCAFAGDAVMVTILGPDVAHMAIGNVVCGLDSLIPVTNSFLAQIIVFDVDIPLTIGVPVVFHHMSQNEPAHITALHSIMDKATGEILKRNPKALAKNTTANVTVQLGRAVCLETFRECKEFGRFLLRTNGKTVAAGIVTEINVKK